MESYTLKDLKDIQEAKTYLTRDRFMYFFINRYGHSPESAEYAFKLFCMFPKCPADDKYLQEKMDTVVSQSLKAVGELFDGWESNRNVENISYDEKELRKLIYKTKDAGVEELVLNLHDVIDIVTYSEKIKQGVQIIALLRYCCSVENNKTGGMDVFEGDIFCTDDTYCEKSSVYIAGTNGNFKKLLYTEGLGYLRNGKPDYAEGNFNSNVLRLSQWVKMGNTTMDMVKLTDKSNADAK